MNISKFAYRSLLIRKIRTILTIFGVGIVIAVFFSVYTFSNGYQQALNREYKTFGINILAVPKGCPYEATALLMHGGKVDKSMNFEQLKAIRENPGVDIVSPIHIHHAKLNPGNLTTAMYGIEETMFQLKPEWKIVGSHFSKNDAPEAYLGINAFQKMGIKLGDDIEVNVVLGTEKKQFHLKLVGYLEQTGTSDDNFIFMPIDFVTTVVPPGHTIKGMAIRVKSGFSIAKVSEEIAKIPDVQTVTYKQVQYTLNDLLNTTTQLLNLAMLFTLLIGIVGLLNTIFMSIEDRKKELGMLKAIGAGNKDIIQIIMTETGILVTIGAIFGILLSLMISKSLEILVRKLITSAPPGQLATYTPMILVGTIVISILIGTIASIFPCIKATKISPMEVIRNE